MPAKILGDPQGRLTKKVQDTLLAKGITSEIISPGVLELTGDWRTNGAVDYRADYETHNQMLPLIYIDGVCYSFMQAMEKYEPKNVKWKVWAPSPAVCSKAIAVAIKDDIIQEVLFSGGCDGNSKCIDRLLYGTSVQMAKHLLGDIICGDKRTSCGRELARGL